MVKDQEYLTEKAFYCLDLAKKKELRTQAL